MENSIGVLYSGSSSDGIFCISASVTFTMATHNVFPEADKEMSDFAHAVLNNNKDEVVEILKKTDGLVTKQVTYQKHPRIKGYHALLLATGR